ncbi:MAG: phosphatase PAP2 family protein [Aequorivita antarctica]
MLFSFFPAFIYSQQIDAIKNNNSALLSFQSFTLNEPIPQNFSYNLKKESTFSVLKNNPTYEWKWLRDGIWTGAGISVSTAGLILSSSKNGLSLADQEKFLNNASLQKEIDKISSIDRWAAGKHSESARSLSDAILYTSLTAPIALLFNDNINAQAGEYIAIYIESLATSSALYSLTARFVDKSRPFVYDNSGETSNYKRFNNSGQRSFYSGHVAATATATFFAAKAYCDFNPDTNGKEFIWAGAATIPAVVGYLRIESGQHFLTDVALGYALGAATGILVPELHKKKHENIEIYPSSSTSFNGEKLNGMTFRYTF